MAIQKDDDRLRFDGTKLYTMRVKVDLNGAYIGMEQVDVTASVAEVIRKYIRHNDENQ